MSEVRKNGGHAMSEIWHENSLKTDDWIRLEAAAVDDAFSLQHLPEMPFTAAETSPGTLTLFPATVPLSRCDMRESGELPCRAKRYLTWSTNHGRGLSWRPFP